jgi:Ala-tRNA(Pro) deacylase
MSLAHRVENFLERHEVDFSVQLHPWSSSSLAAAHSAHVDEDSVAKSVVLEDERGFVLAVLPASHRLELDRLRTELGRALHLSGESAATRLFPDCAVGAIPPLGAAYGLETVLDTKLEGREEIFFEGGDHESLVRVAGNVFLDLLTNAAVAEIATDSPRLNAAIVLREKLHDSLQALSRSISAPVGQGQRWCHRVDRSLLRVAAALDEHISETEGPDGVLREIVEQAPRLWREVDALEVDHTTLAESCREIQENLSRRASPQATRRRALKLIERFEHHRHRGADLAYEAFGVDIGGG